LVWEQKFNYAVFPYILLVLLGRAIVKINPTSSVLSIERDPPFISKNSFIISSPTPFPF